MRRTPRASVANERVGPESNPSTRAPAKTGGTRSGFRPTGEIVESATGLPMGIHMLAPQMPQTKNAKPEQFVDLSFSNEVEKEGFFTEVAKRYPAK